MAALNGVSARLPLRYQRLISASSFVGRDLELAQARALLAAGRLVTVTGIGGVGKTRFALRAAELAAGRFADGVVVADLQEVRDPAALPGIVAAALEPDDPGGGPAPGTLLSSLRDRSLLLILDGCEPLADECARFAGPVLAAAPGVTILATSRQPLGRPGEAVYRLGPMPVPDREAGPAGEAAELFAQRAAAIVPGFAVTPENQGDVVTVCRRLDGIPLAIELAAVRLRALSLRELSRRLADHRFDVLSGGRRGTQTRHYTLRAAIGWSHELCSQAERALWARLSVFEGEFAADAAAEVCADTALPRASIPGGLDGLAAKSVLLPVDGPEPRFRMLDTIRQYGAEKLDTAAEADEVRGRHVQRYLRLAGELDADPLTGQSACYPVLRAEHDDILAAIRRSLAGPGQEATGARLVLRLYWYWVMSGLIQEGRYWLALVLRRFTEPSPERARALLLHGAAVAALGDPGSGVADCEAGLAMTEHLGDEDAHARGHLYYCQALFAAGRLDAAGAAARKAAALMAEAGDSGAVRLLSVFKALRALATGNPRECSAVCSQELLRIRPGADHRPDAQEQWTRSVLQGLTGIALFLLGETEHGAGLIRDVLAERHRLGDALGMAYGLSILAFMATAQRRFQRAAWLAGASVPLWERIGNEFPGVPCLGEMAARAAAGTREVLGETIYSRLHRAGRHCPRELAVTLAIDDADELPFVPVPPGSPEQGTGSRGRARATALTDRERDVAALMAEGLTNREIAGRLNLSTRTVETHVSRVFEKLGISSRAQLAVRIPGDR